MLILAQRSTTQHNKAHINIDNTHRTAYNTNVYRVESTEEYIEWFAEFDGNTKKEILRKVDLLKEFGFMLGRPHADTLYDSMYSNLKELRLQTENHVIRIAYIFDKERKAFLLIGGDKKGKDQKLFYKELINKAEALIRKYRLK